jgi:hypothetical protein
MLRYDTYRRVIIMKKIIVLLLICCVIFTSGVYGAEREGDNVPVFDFSVDPNNLEGSLTELMDYLKWFNNHLDETNVKYLAWGDSLAENIDASHKLKIKFYIPDGVLQVKKLTLNFSVEAFRAYETGAENAIASVISSGNTSGNQLAVTADEFYGNTTAHWGHTHDVTDEGGTYTTTDSGLHSHEMPYHNHIHAHNVTIPEHTHEILYGIYESTSAEGCKVYVDGTLRLDNGGAGYSTDQSNLDLTQWVTTAGWHTIEISSTQLGRINAAYFTQVYVGASGI